MVEIYPLPLGEPASEDYAITLNGTQIQAYKCRVSAIPFNTTWPGTQRPLDQTEIASFISFDMTTDHEPAYLQVDVPHNFSEAVVRPLSKNVRPSWEGNSISFTIFKPGQYTLEIDGHHHALHIFVNPAKDFGIDKTAPNVRYFGPGIHRPGKLELKSDDVLFIDAGAVVHTSVKARDAKNLRIVGYGILDNSEFHRTTYTCFGCPTCLELFNCENVTIEGIIFRDACAWTLTAYNCRNLSIQNAKTIGMWRYNSDGFDLVNCQNVIIADSFLRNFDDCIVLKGFPPYNYANVENITVAGCVIWCDWGRGLEIGAETCADEYRNILFTDCDVIHSTHVALDVQNSGNAHVHDVVFEDIRIEYSKHCDEPIYQHSMDMEYPQQTKSYLPNAMLIEVSPYYHDMLIPDADNGRNSAITFRDIFITTDEGLDAPPSRFSGLSEHNNTTDIRVHNLWINGKKVEDISESGIQIGEYATDIIIK